jgi:hypothetical protein
MKRSQIDRISAGTFCTVLLSSGHTISAQKDAKPSWDGPGGWYVAFYEEAATGRGRLREWSVCGNSIVAIGIRPEVEG